MGLVGVGVHVSWHGASGGLSSVQVGRETLVGQDAWAPRLPSPRRWYTAGRRSLATVPFFQEG